MYLQTKIQNPFRLPKQLGCSLTLVRASERKFSRGYEGRYRAPKSYCAPQALSGPMAVKSFFAPMGADLLLKVRG